MDKTPLVTSGLIRLSLSHVVHSLCKCGAIGAIGRATKVDVFRGSYGRHAGGVRRSSDLRVNTGVLRR